MEIILQTVRIIDYENNQVYTRDVPENFSEYVAQLITYINGNSTVRKYKTRSIDTEVVSCILDIIDKGEENKNFVINKINQIANRLLQKEVEAQNRIAQLNRNVQRGSLIQALLYHADVNKYTYLLAKVEHSDFVDDSDFSFKCGFSKDQEKMWKSCIFDIDNLSATEIHSKIYSNTKAKYWHNDFLELDELESDERNTDLAFRAIDSTLSRNIKNKAPKDYTIIRNSIISYFKTNQHIDYDIMVQTTLEPYVPVELEEEKMQTFIDKIKLLPDKQSFDRQFNSVHKIINSKIKKSL